MLSAIDLATGRMKWQPGQDQALVGGVLATAGDLVFMGEGSGHFNATTPPAGKPRGATSWMPASNATPVTWQIDACTWACAAGGNQIFGYKAGDTFQVYRLGQ